jgi:hypothetical protein
MRFSHEREEIMGRKATYRVTLSEEERKELRAMTHKGKESARKVLLGRALLLLDEGEFGVDQASRLYSKKTL